MRTWALVLVCALGVGGDAQALFSVFSEIQGQVVQTGGINPIEDTFDHNLFADTFPDANVIQVMNDDGGVGLGSCAAGVSATFGALSGSSDASDGEDPQVYPFASASGLADAEVFDTLHLYSASLPDGTPVTLDFALNVNSNAPTYDGNPSASAVATASLDAHPETVGTAVHLEYGNFDPPILELTGTLQAYVGQYVALHYDIYAHSRLVAGASAFGMQAGLSILPRIHADGANPDVTVTTDSGFDYGLPVPEPSQAASEGVVEAMGLACLAIRSARRRRCLPTGVCTRAR